MNRPLPDEYPEYYAQYINLVKDGNIIEILSGQSEYFREILSSIPEEKAGASYAFGKWTIKEMVGHLIDNERLMAVRSLRMARGDKQRMPGYDQDNYVKAGQFFKRTLSGLTDELMIVRASSLILFKTFDEETLLTRGIVNDVELTVRAILYLIAGHEAYHIKFLQENYLQNHI